MNQKVGKYIKISDKEKIFFTSDLHFNHSNIIKYCNRPFSSSQEMDEELISRWNEKVPPNGIVFVIGDVAFSKEEYAVSILKRLNGVKILITGNHDRYLINPTRNPSTKFRDCFEYITDLMEISVRDSEREDGKTDFVLCHYAMRVWNKSHHGAIQLYGHSHGTLPPFGFQMDVGVDTNNFYPYSYDDILIKLWKTKNSLKGLFSDILVKLATWIAK